MGFFDKIKGALGGNEPEKDVTVSPSQLLREAGIDPSGLKFGFGTGTITVSGTIANEADREKIKQALSGLDGISTVNDNMVVAAVEAEPEPAPEPEATPEPPAPAAAEPEAGSKTYTVQSGDSLWKIAEEMYGNGSKYMKIFEANKDLLDNPDKIFPGQELKIPDLED